MTPLMKQLQGDWLAVELNRDGTEMPAEWLSFGSRVTTGNETKVVFGGQVMVHAKMRFDQTSTPMSVDYLNLAGAAKGKVSLGLFEWTGPQETMRDSRSPYQANQDRRISRRRKAAP
jgi:uncharacterized protein (TIGR03067 family)